ncbi:hypothetical protein BBD41_22870 [Paenibacillus ihbetae]|uniref:Saccharopine dehydrogenase n=1 Tax=Paenibacillus ihbetae TaxID=1870820 RepID=A0A1B2E5D4_9BACL|nr:hypothetical protein [Paenibacillus ihbetae]ANY75185.1 hypothetical protein BBD41_22870 [Paenibacillus ihbetae]
MQRIYIAGGYGVVGRAVARHIRTINQDAEIILAGRNPDKGSLFAQELGNARAAFLDIRQGQSPPELNQASLIVSTIQDPADFLIQEALAKGIAHIGITKLADELTPTLFAMQSHPPLAPIVPLGHSQAGILTLVVYHEAKSFRSIHSIGLAGHYDERDPMGPMTLEETEGFINRALIRENGIWKWVEATKYPRSVRLSNGSLVEGHPMSVLDVPSLAAVTGAPNIRFDFAIHDSIGTRSGGTASQDLYIDLEGVLLDGRFVKRRITLSDPKGQSHFTALGILLSIERILGWDGSPPAPGGFYLPETLVPLETAMARIEQFGIQILREEREGEPS